MNQSVPASYFRAPSPFFEASELFVFSWKIVRFRYRYRCCCCFLAKSMQSTQVYLPLSAVYWPNRAWTKARLCEELWRWDEYFWVIDGLFSWTSICHLQTKNTTTTKPALPSLSLSWHSPPPPPSPRQPLVFPHTIWKKTSLHRDENKKSNSHEQERGLSKWTCTSDLIFHRLYAAPAGQSIHDFPMSRVLL